MAKRQLQTRTSPTAGASAELKQRLLFVLGALVVFRIGTFIPVPGIDPVALEMLFDQQRGTILDMFNMFSGGALERFSIFAIGIMPYISASIIMQLLTHVDPRLKELRKEGESGRRKITRYTRYGTVALAMFQSLGVAIALEAHQAGSLQVVVDPGWGFRITAVTTLVAGTIFLMWLGEQCQRARHRQRHIHHHLRGNRGGASVRDRRNPGVGQNRRTARLHGVRVARARPRSDGIRGVRRTRPAPDHGQLCAPAGGAQGLCGPEQPPAVEAEHGRRDPSNLRVEHHSLSRNPGRMVWQCGRNDVAEGLVDDDAAGAADLCHVVCCGDHLFLFLLHRIGIRSQGNSGQSAKIGRIHSGSSTWRADGAIHRRGDDEAYGVRRRIPSPLYAFFRNS